MPGPQDGSYDFSEPFNPKDWAMYHERICASRWTSTDLKLGWIMKGGGAAASVAFAVVLGLLGWSLKTNYDSLEAQRAVATALPATIAQTARQASDETVRKLGATNAVEQP
jgi:hypothetical protein